MLHGKTGYYIQNILHNCTILTKSVEKVLFLYLIFDKNYLKYAVEVDIIDNENRYYML